MTENLKDLGIHTHKIHYNISSDQLVKKAIQRKEGKVSKFIADVEQITFNAEVALKNRKPVLYITERCVFELTVEGMRLKEVAAGVDIKTEIVELLPFSVIADDVGTMDPRIFLNEVMNLGQRDELSKYRKLKLAKKLVA